MNYFTKDDFKKEWLGKSSGLGGYYNQCVTLFKEFLKKAGYPKPGRAIGGSGGAREIWYRRVLISNKLATLEIGLFGIQFMVGTKESIMAM